MNKRNFPTPEAFKSALAPMPPEFERQTREMLLALREETEERPMKKKLSASLVLAMALVLVTCFTALALSIWRDDAEQLVQMQSDIGYFDEWDLASKLKLLSLMEKNGVEMDAALLAAAQDEAAPDQERQNAADAIIAGRYGINGRTDTVTAVGILETELGADFYDWSIEDMAWFCQLEMKFTNASPDAEVFTLPQEGELTQEQALQKAKEALKNILNIDIDSTPYEKLQVQYVVYPYMGPPMNQPEWRFTWLYEDDSEEMVYISSTGEINWMNHADIESPDEKWAKAKAARRAELEERVGPDTKWSLEDWVYYDPNYYCLPTEDDITPEQAIQIAQEALMKEQGFTQADLDSREASLKMRLSYVTPEGKWQYIYSVTFTPKETSDGTWDSYVTIYSDSGEVQRTYFKRPNG